MCGYSGGGDGMMWRGVYEIVWELGRGAWGGGRDSAQLTYYNKY